MNIVPKTPCLISLGRAWGNAFHRCAPPVIAAVLTVQGIPGVGTIGCGGRTVTTLCELPALNQCNCFTQTILLLSCSDTESASHWISLPGIMPQLRSHGKAREAPGICSNHITAPESFQQIFLNFIRAYLKTGNVPNSSFFRWASHFSREYRLYCKGKWYARC